MVAFLFEVEMRKDKKCPAAQGYIKTSSLSLLGPPSEGGRRREDEKTFAVGVIGHNGYGGFLFQSAIPIFSPSRAGPSASGNGARRDEKRVDGRGDKVVT